VDPRDPREPRDLDAIVDRSLKALPPPRAPRTLLPRVMAAVAAAERARAPQRTWFTWPLLWQAASVAGVVLLAWAAIVVGPALRDAVGASMPGAATAAFSRVAALVDSASSAMRVGSIVGETYLRPIAGYVLAWVVLMSAACATFGLALGRVALGGASH
jgi:hypothetical protein